jgi:hypothetical protein
MTLFNSNDTKDNIKSKLSPLKPTINTLASSKYIANDLYTLTPNEFQIGYTTDTVLNNTTPKINNAPLSTTEDAAKEDINTMLLQQNTLYTMGVLTATTFLITAILLAK